MMFKVCLFKRCALSYLISESLRSKIWELEVGKQEVEGQLKGANDKVTKITAESTRLERQLRQHVEVFGNIPNHLEML